MTTAFGSQIRRGFVSPRRPGKPPAAAGTGTGAYSDLTYHGGRIINIPTVHVLFVGDWSSTANQNRQTRLTQFITDLLNSRYMNILSQYGCGLIGSVGSVSPATAPSSTLSAADIHGIIQSAITAAKIPEPTDESTCVILYLDDATAVDDAQADAVMCEASSDSAFGYHYYFTTAAGNAYPFAVVPGLTNTCLQDSCPGPQGDANCTLHISQTQEQRQTQVTSHELSEMFSDPEANAWYSPTYGEIGDICNGQSATITVGANTWTVQKMYSKTDDMNTNGATTCITDSDPLPWLLPPQVLAGSFHGGHGTTQVVIPPGGDFTHAGHAQAMFLNRTQSGGRVLVADFSSGQPPAQVRYWEDWGQSTLLNGWEDDNGWYLVGDFAGVGHDQVMFFNRTDAGNGRVLVADFSSGKPPAQVKYWEYWGRSRLLDGWEDANSWCLVGDFTGAGHDQVMFLNRTQSGGRVLIADFSSGAPPAQVRYWENWGQSTLLNGWEDDNDWCLAGDFTGAGHDQVMFLNRTQSGGRVLVADFSSGQPPAQVRYWENWGQSPLLNGWEDDNDWCLAGDFTGAGHDQVMFLNRTTQSGGRVLVADFSSGQPPAQVRYWENWGQSPLLNGWEDNNDWYL